jgi:hypothetical protein
MHGLFNPLNAELNPICHLLALFGAHHILHVSRVRVKILCQYSAERTEERAGTRLEGEPRDPKYWHRRLPRK